MAECVASPMCVKLHMQRKHVEERGFLSQTTNFKFVHRKYSRNGCKIVHLPAWKTLGLSTFGASNVKFSRHPRATCLQCTRLAALVDIDGVTASTLVPVIDQVLLMASILLTYMAGVIPSTKSYTIHQKTISEKHVASQSLGASGSALKNDYQLDSKYIFNVVRGKILGSLNALEHDTYSGDCVFQSLNRPLSLNAVAEGPKLQLLWAAFQQVEDEVNNISSFSGPLVMDDWFSVFSEVIQRSCTSIFVAWLEKEVSFQKCNAGKPLRSMVLEKLKGDNIIVRYIKRSGKEGLYTELLCYLTFGSLREDCCYDACLFALHGVSILEDLVIALADGIASMYLEFISVDSDVSSETNSLDISFCTLSTRELQKLRNEVALNQWLYHNMDTVVSMYEDRFDLCTFESQPIALSVNSQTENRSWWKQFIQRKSKTISSELHCIVISHFSMPVKRTKELRALTGWRYYFSLFLELSDITTPLIRAVIDKVSDGISFFLVCLIGRSLGLIYTGIRQSLRWK